jgi:membrane protein
MWKKIMQHPYYQAVVRWMKQVHFGDKEVTLFLIVAVFVQKFRNNSISVKASAVAFSLTLAIFPALIFIFTLIPYLPIDDLRNQVVNFFDTISPSSLEQSFKNTIIDVVREPHSDLLSFGFISALFLASNGMIALIDAFDSCYHGTVKRRGLVKKRLVAIALTIMLAFILLITIVALVAGEVIVDALVYNGIVQQGIPVIIINVLRYVIVCSMFFASISVMYYFGPSIHKRWRFFSAGAVMATALAVLFSSLFGFYIDNFSNYNKLYGSLGALFGIMFWLWAIAHVLLIGFEVNSTLEYALEDRHRLRAGHFAAFDRQDMSGFYDEFHRRPEE